MSASSLDREISIRVPATTANLGPGYDCLGVALGISNIVTVGPSTGEAHSAMVSAAAAAFFEASNVDPVVFGLKVKGDVPSARGLGSSVTVRLGLLHGLNELHGRPLSKRKLFALCAALEGHPDNAAPAAFGGFTIARAGDPECIRFDVLPSLRFILLIPDFEVSTPSARGLSPRKFRSLTLPGARATLAGLRPRSPPRITISCAGASGTISTSRTGCRWCRSSTMLFAPESRLARLAVF